MLQNLERGQPLQIDALVAAVSEMGRLAGIETPYIDSVRGLIQQRGRVPGLYPTFPGPDGETDEETRDAMVD